MSAIKKSIYIDVKKHLFRELLELARHFDEEEAYVDFPKQEKQNRKKQNKEKREFSFINRIYTGQRIVYPPLHQKWIYEIRAKYGIPVIQGFSDEAEKTDGPSSYGINFDVKGGFIFSPLIQLEEGAQNTQAYKVWEKETDKNKLRRDILEILGKISENLSIPKTSWLDFLESFVIFGIPSMCYEKPYSQLLRETFGGERKISIDANFPLKEINKNLKHMVNKKPKEASYDAALYLEIAEGYMEGLTDVEIVQEIGRYSYKDIQNNRQAMLKKPEWKLGLK